jgi:hypothetical protein
MGAARWLLALLALPVAASQNLWTQSWLADQSLSSIENTKTIALLAAKECPEPAFLNGVTPATLTCSLLDKTQAYLDDSSNGCSAGFSKMMESQIKVLASAKGCAPDLSLSEAWQASKRAQTISLLAAKECPEPAFLNGVTPATLTCSLLDKTQAYLDDSSNGYSAMCRKMVESSIKVFKSEKGCAPDFSLSEAWQASKHAQTLGASSLQVALVGVIGSIFGGISSLVLMRRRQGPSQAPLLG